MSRRNSTVIGSVAFPSSSLPLADKWTASSGSDDHGLPFFANGLALGKITFMTAAAAEKQVYTRWQAFQRRDTHSPPAFPP